MNTLDIKFKSIISICDNIETKHNSNNGNFSKIKEKLLSLGHSYIDITELIGSIVDTNGQISTEINKLKIVLTEYNKEILSKMTVLETQNTELTRNVNLLMIENQKHKDMMVIRETVLKFNNII